MKRLAIVLSVLVVGCKESEAPGPGPTGEPTQFATGVWQTGPISSADRRVLDLHFVGDSVFGTEHEYAAGGAQTAAGTVTGASSGTSIWLAINYEDGNLGTYVGHLTATDTADGTWAVTSPTRNFPLRFARQP